MSEKSEMADDQIKRKASENGSDAPDPARTIRMSAKELAGLFEEQKVDPADAAEAASRAMADARAADDVEMASRAMAELASEAKRSDEEPAEDDAAEAAAEALASLSDLSSVAVLGAQLNEEFDKAAGKNAVEGSAKNAAETRELDARAVAQSAQDEKTSLLSERQIGASLTQDLTRELPGRGSVPPHAVIGETMVMRPGNVAKVSKKPEPVPPRKIHHHLSRGKKAAILVAIVAGLGLIGYAGYQWKQTSRQQQAAEQKQQVASTMVDVPISVKIAGLSTALDAKYDAVGSKIPVQVSGQDASGSIVDQVGYVDEKGRGLRLMPGDYSLSVPASPIAADGTVYAVPEKPIKVEVRTDVKDYASAGTLEFSVPSAASVSDSQIAQAYEFASKGGAPSEEVAGILKQAATARRDAAVSAAGGQSTVLRREADKLHKATDSYSFDLPRSWYGLVTTAQNGDNVYVRLASNSKVIVCQLSVQKDGFATGDANDGVLGSVSVGNGYNVVVSGPTYPWVIQQTALGKTKDAVDSYPEDEAVELVRLQTGDTYTMEQIKRGVTGDKMSQQDAMKLVQDYLAKELLSSVKAS